MVMGLFIYVPIGGFKTGMFQFSPAHGFDFQRKDDFMLTSKMNYKISGVVVQGLILRQMRMAALYTHEWDKAMNNGDENGDYTYCKLKNYEQAEIWPLLEIQGIERDTDEFSMVMGYIVDLIDYMA